MTGKEGKVRLLHRLASALELSLESIGDRRFTEPGETEGITTTVLDDRFREFTRVTAFKKSDYSILGVEQTMLKKVRPIISQPRVKPLG